LVAVAALIVVGGLLRSDDQVDTSTVSQREGRTLGSPMAAVTVTAWEDFQCPVCKAANASVVERLIQEYVETGKVQFHYRYFSFIGQESVWAAEAAESAGEQGKFWEYHDALFAAQAGENRGAFNRDRLKGIAEDLALDIAMFNAAFDSGKYSEVVKAEREEGEKLGVKGTPSFFVDGVPVNNWRDYSEFKAKIDLLLAAAQ
jgi:protein-disulfide isomerase